MWTASKSIQIVGSRWNPFVQIVGSHRVSWTKISHDLSSINLIILLLSFISVCSQCSILIYILISDGLTSDIFQVLETTPNVGRFSVYAAPDVSFEEMTSHCESLLTRKQQKLSAFTNSQKKQENVLADIASDHHESIVSLFTHFDTFQWVFILLILFFTFMYLLLPCFVCHKSNPYVHLDDVSFQDQNSQLSPHSTQHQNDSYVFRLPTSIPHDVFLKTAGCL